jgi:hypothetical protein
MQRRWVKYKKLAILYSEMCLLRMSTNTIFTHPQNAIDFDDLPIVLLEFALEFPAIGIVELNEVTCVDGVRMTHPSNKDVTEPVSKDFDGGPGTLSKIDDTRRRSSHPTQKPRKIEQITTVAIVAAQDANGAERLL